MNKRGFLVSAAAFACGTALAATVDFGVETGKLRPELHSSGFGPTICSQTAQDLADIRAMGFSHARTHDWALVNANQRVCDYFHIFPLMHLDAKDPANYVFGPTDYLLARTREEMGCKIFFRLGTSIEHSGKKVHFNSLVPTDFDKVAETFAGTVRHYNRGWANGHRWNIRYWEIWNEPDGIENMWSPPEGIDGLSKSELTEKRAAYRDLFVKFFVTVLRRLKTEFGEEIRVGGPALCSYDPKWFVPLLEACKAGNVAPDFISWHGYTNDPTKFAREAEAARALCDGYGFKACELIVNEWHYFGRDDYSCDDMQRCSDPKVKARIWTGPRSHNGIHSACFTLANLANLQRSKLDQAYFYGCSHTGAWGFKGAHQVKYKVFPALTLFGDIIRDYTTICASESEGSVTTLAVKNAAGHKALLVVDYGGTSSEIAVSVKGVGAGAKVRCKVLDATHDLAPQTVVFAEGRLSIRKNNEHSAAFFVEFAD